MDFSDHTIVIKTCYQKDRKIDFNFYIFWFKKYTSIFSYNSLFSSFLCYKNIFIVRMFYPIPFWHFFFGLNK